VATRKPASEEDASDFNTGVAVLVRKVTGTKRVRGEDLLSDPKMKKRFQALKKRAAAKKR
jgi:hypothetical protein